MQSSKQNSPSLDFSHTTKIDTLLSPIFDAVRKNKINSYYQFRKFSLDPSHTGRTTSHYIFTPKPNSNTIDNPKTPKQDSIKTKPMSKTFYHEREGNHKKFSGSANDRMNVTAYATLNTRNTRTPSSLKAAITRQNSKIKKHLVETIDFEEIEKMLYKKRDMVTRYEHFYQKIKQNRRRRQSKYNETLDHDQLQCCGTPVLNQSLQIKQEKSIEKKQNTIESKQSKRNRQKKVEQQKITMSQIKELTPDIDDSKSTIFRMTPRKKFWSRDGASPVVSPRRGKLKEKSEIAQLIEGKSFQGLLRKSPVSGVQRID